MQYWNLFRESFGKLLHPTLWLFGFLAALGGGFNANINISERRPITDLPPGMRALLGDALRNNAPTIIAAGLIITLVLLIFGTFGQTALLSLINRLENGERVSVGKGFDDASRRFLHLLAVRVLLWLPLFVIGILAAGSLLSAISGFFADQPNEQLFNFGDLGRMLGLTGLALLLSIVIGGISIGAERAVVLEERPIFEALNVGVNLLLRQLGDYIVIAVMFIMVSIAFGLIFACVLIPTMLTGASFGSFGTSTFLETDIRGSMAVFALIFGLIIGTFGSIYTASVWTLAYRQWRPQVVKRVAQEPMF